MIVPIVKLEIVMTFNNKFLNFYCLSQHYS